MGGIVCAIPWRAIVRYTSVPPQRDDQKKLEAQLRQAFAVPSIYEAVAAEGKGPEVCNILEKSKLTAVDLERLLDLSPVYVADDTPGG